MDKETLSNYGWIVICILVLAVMLALATPFGKYISTAIENTTEALFDTQKNALGAAGLDIADQSFGGGGSSDGDQGGTEIPTEPDTPVEPETPTEPVTPVTFTFSLDGNTYIAEEGMTWALWCDSSYNTNGYVINGNNIESSDGNTVESVLSSDLISADANYTVTEPEPETPPLVLEAGATIPEEATYYVGVTATAVGNYTGATATYTTGQTMPTPQTGDVFVYGDYEYRFNMKYDWEDYWAYTQNIDGWAVQVLNKSQTEYGAIYETINGKYVKDMRLAFNHCASLINAPKIPSGVTSIGYETFNYCTNLTSITIPDTVTSIGNYVFYYCTSLTSITIPDSVTSIGSGAFYGCSSLETVTLGSSVTSIGDHAFYECSSLESITIPDSVTTISTNTFSYCTSLTSITIPDTVTSIGSGAFAHCTSLTSITIPDSVTSISDSVFWYSTNLTSITFTGTKAQWNNISKSILWDSETGNYTIYCTDGTIAKS